MCQLYFVIEKHKRLTQDNVSRHYLHQGGYCFFFTCQSCCLVNSLVVLWNKSNSHLHPALFPYLMTLSNILLNFIISNSGVDDMSNNGCFSVYQCHVDICACSVVHQDGMVFLVTSLICAEKSLFYVQHVKPSKCHTHFWGGWCLNNILPTLRNHIWPKNTHVCCCGLMGKMSKLPGPCPDGSWSEGPCPVTTKWIIPCPIMKLLKPTHFCSIPSPVLSPWPPTHSSIICIDMNIKLTVWSWHGDHIFAMTLLCSGISPHSVFPAFFLE